MVHIAWVTDNFNKWFEEVIVTAAEVAPKNVLWVAFLYLCGRNENQLTTREPQIWRS